MKQKDVKALKHFLESRQQKVSHYQALQKTVNEIRASTVNGKPAFCNFGNLKFHVLKEEGNYEYKEGHVYFNKSVSKHIGDIPYDWVSTDEWSDLLHTGEVKTKAGPTLVDKELLDLKVKTYRKKLKDLGSSLRHGDTVEFDFNISKGVVAIKLISDCGDTIYMDRGRIEKGYTSTVSDY